LSETTRLGTYRRSPRLGPQIGSAAAGQNDVAKAALRERRRAQPNISLAWIDTQIPIKHDADGEHYLEGFRRAGLE
jgi:hypothetical protein